MLSYLEGMPSGGEGHTVYLPPGLTSEQVARHYSSVLRLVPDALVNAAQSSKTGSCFFSSALTLIVPPFPITDAVVFQGTDKSMLSGVLERDRLIGIVLVRLGSYAVALCRGEEVLSSKVGTGLVHARQRQGGSSSQRFRRRREKQIEQFLLRVCDHAEEHIGPSARMLDHAVFGGALTTIHLLQKACPLCERLGRIALPSLLDIPDPRQPVLESAVKRIWSSRVTVFSPEDSSGAGLICREG